MCEKSVFDGDGAPRLGETVKLEIADLNNLGCGVGRIGGFVVFVRGAVTGDVVSAKIIKVNKKFAVARLSDIHVSSPLRAAESECCREPLSCGGCVYREITYAHELERKRSYVKSAFAKAGIPDAEVLPVLGTGEMTRYRNKAQYPVGKNKNGIYAGFYTPKTHNIVPIDDCMLQNPIFAEIVRFICSFAEKNGIEPYDEKSGKGLLRHIYLRSADASGAVAVCLVLRSASLPHADELVSGLTAAFPAVSGIMLNVNDRNTNVVLGERYILLWGSEYLEDTLLGKRFRIAPAAFYQVNRRGAELLYSKALELAVRGKSTSSLVDLYCGTGTIGICMAEKFGRLVGVDIVPASVECARENARLNGINNASFYCADAGDARSILNCVCENGVHLHDATVVIDPPRKGTTAELISMLAEGGCPRVVYVSCDPDTLARDAAVFISHGYSISEIQPVDMFPRTGHVECVVLMTGSKNKL